MTKVNDRGTEGVFFPQQLAQSVLDYVATGSISLRMNLLEHQNFAQQIIDVSKTEEPEANGSTDKNQTDGD